MKTQGDRQNFNWRPNDYSSTTRLRYDMEVDHWLDSIKGVTSKTTSSLSETLGFLGLLIGLVINLVIIVVLCLTYFFKWLLGFSKKETKNETVGWVREKPLTNEELQELIDNGKLENSNLYED